MTRQAYDPEFSEAYRQAVASDVARKRIWSALRVQRKDGGIETLFQTDVEWVRRNRPDVVRVRPGGQTAYGYVPTGDEIELTPGLPEAS